MYIYVYRWSSWYDICYCRERESGEVDSLTEAPFSCVMNIMTRDVFPGQGSLSSRSKCKPGMSKLIPSLWPYPRPVWLPKHTTVLFWRPKSTAFFQPWGDHRYPLWRGVVSHVGRSDSWLVTWEVLALQSLFHNSKAVGNGPASCFWNQNLVFMIVLWWRSSCGHHFRIDTQVLSKVLSSFWGSIPVATKHRFASNWPLHLQLLSWPFADVSHTKPPWYSTGILLRLKEPQKPWEFHHWCEGEPPAFLRRRTDSFWSTKCPMSTFNTSCNREFQTLACSGSAYCTQRPDHRWIFYTVCLCWPFFVAEEPFWRTCTNRSAAWVLYLKPFCCRADLGKTLTPKKTAVKLPFK